MDSIFFNGNIVTMNGERATAAAVRDGRFAYVGNDAEALALKTADTRIVDLGGRLTLPGFIDTHIHLLGHGQYLSLADLAHAKTKQEAIDIGRRFLEAHPDVKVLAGAGWNNDDWSDDSTFPDRYDLDSITADIPVVYTRTCYHVQVLNSRALEVCGLDENSPDIAGGVIYRDENGVPTGVLCETATDYGDRLQSEPTEESVKAFFRAAAADAASCGLTTVHTDDLYTYGNDWLMDIARLYRELADEGMPLRIYAQCRFPDAAYIREYFASGAPFRDGDDMFRMGPLKIVSDGSLGARTAYLSAPYHDAPDTKGVMLFTFEEIDDMVVEAARHGMASSVHAIGDGAINAVLDSFEKARAVEPYPLRHSIIHCQITDKAILDRMEKLNIMAEVQPIFLDYDLHIAESRVGHELSSTSYAFNTMLKRGFRMSFGSDCPVERFNVIQGIYHAVTRKDLNGFPEGGWFPDECVTVEEAVRAFTSEAAYASGDENVKGRIAVGLLADMAVLDRDIFAIPADEIKDANVDITVLGGRVIYTRGQ